MALGRLGYKYGSFGHVGGGGNSNVLWTPLNLGTSLLIWFDAADTSTMTMSGGNVMVWNSKGSTPGVAAANGTQSLSPAYTGGGLVFPKFSQIALEIFGTMPSNYDLCAVGTPQGAGGYANLLTTNNLATHTVILDVGTFTVGQYDSIFRTSGLTWSGQSVLYTSYIPGVSYSMALNAGTVGNIVSGFPGDPITTIGNDQIGGAGNQGFGTIYDLVFTTQGLSTSNSNKLIGYEAWKYGLQGSLPGGFPYKSRAPYVSDP